MGVRTAGSLPKVSRAPSSLGGGRDGREAAVSSGAGTGLLSVLGDWGEVGGWRGSLGWRGCFPTQRRTRVPLSFKETMNLGPQGPWGRQKGDWAGDRRLGPSRPQDPQPWAPCGCPLWVPVGTPPQPAGLLLLLFPFPLTSGPAPKPRQPLFLDRTSERAGKGQARKLGGSASLHEFSFFSGDVSLKSALYPYSHPHWTSLAPRLTPQGGSWRWW